MHEGLPKEIVGSVSRTGEEALRAEKGPSSTSLLPSQSSSLNRQGNATMKKLALLALPLAITALAQSARSQAPPYCFDLTRIVDLAVTKERFASIAGRPRPGDFRDTSLILAEWKDCSLYGAATYTCDSAEMDTAAAADEARLDILDQVKSCLGAGWAEAAERTSPSYVVLHNATRPVSITLSTDQTDSKRHVVRLTIFVRRN
jgi:hypothetical protein